MYNCLAFHLLRKAAAKPRPMWKLYVNNKPVRTSSRARLERVK